jgi:salicylate hydroxylase
MAISKVLILGGGIAGVGAALAFSAQNPNVEIEVFELRSEPSALGGAINLPPNSLRYLNDWGVTEHLVTKGAAVSRIEIYALRTGKLLGTLEYDDIDRFKFRALRISRWSLLECMLEALQKTNAKIHYGKTATKITSDDSKVQIDFADGSTATGDILLGCDGIHSFARMSYVEPERKPVYTGVSVVNAQGDAACITSTPPFETTGMFSGRLGSIMMSYADRDRKTVYAAAVIETPSADSKDGWRLRGADQAALKDNILTRFGDSPNEIIDEFVNAVNEWYLFPVYKLPNKGKWSRDRVILLGDAAHAVSCQTC